MADLRPYSDSNGDTGVGTGRGSLPGIPRWVKGFGIIGLVLVLLIVVLLVTDLGGPGRHGPGRHIPSGDAGGQIPPSGVTEDQTPPAGGHTLPIEHGVQQP